MPTKIAFNNNTTNTKYAVGDHVLSKSLAANLEKPTKFVVIGLAAKFDGICCSFVYMIRAVTTNYSSPSGSTLEANEFELTDWVDPPPATVAKPKEAAA